MESKNKKKKRTFIDSVKNCIDGIIYVYKTENNFKREMIIGLLVVIAGFLLKINITEWAIVILLINFVLVSELINTALEKTVDLYTKEYNEIAKVIKDAAGASVLVVSITSAIVGVLIFAPKIFNIISNL